jgi:uncharacterized oligopeptide transporter (OPT) family protein
VKPPQHELLESADVPQPVFPGQLTDNLSPEDLEARRWLEEVYQGDTVRQISVRSIVTGMIIGGVMSVSNLYVGLKTGWGLGVTITACIIAYAVFRFLETVIPAYRNNPFTILENYTMSSAASAAGYMASAGLVSAFPALSMVTGRMLTWWEMMSWLAAVSVLGVFMAVPLKRQLINIDQLPFPTGIATAETLRSMHTAGVEALQKARSLLWAAVGGGILAFWRDGWAPLIGWAGGRLAGIGSVERLQKLAFPETLPLYPGARGLMDRLTLGFEGSLIMVAAGAIMGIRVGASLLLGAVFYYGLLAPWLLHRHMIAEAGYRGIVAWTVWPATAMMVTSGLLAFGLRWRTVLRAFSGLGALLTSRRGPADPLAHVEVPGSWFAMGTSLSGLACVLLGHWMFGITWWMGILAVLLTFVLSIVAARATGETDVTPIGAMGKITQLTYGYIAPSNMTTNLMTASITAGAASHSADLLTDLKSGYLLGGNPRKQTISQLFGVLAGTIVCVPIYAAIVDPTKLGSAQLPAPSAQVWAKVAQMLAKGFEALPPGAVVAMAIGGVLGILLTLAEQFLPDRYAKWVPSATGLGIAGVIPAFNSISMFLGALGSWLWTRARPRVADKYVIPVSSGLIAGESLMGVAIILCGQGPTLLKEVWHALGG